jgi:DNA-binding NarL/FixJ family response regulator
MKRTRVLLADDHILVMEALRLLLELEFEVVGAVADGRALLAAATELNPDVIVLDISMPMLNGLDAGKQIRQMLPSAKLIYLTMDQDPVLADEALRFGASGYVLKSSAPTELSHAIREGIRGRSYVTPLLTQGRMAGSFLEGAHRKKRSLKLSARGREVLQLLAEGFSMKEVAAILDITPRTVAFHKYKMMGQLQLKTNAELIQFAIKQHLISA